MKYCKNCGNEIDDNAYVCPKCGVKVAEETQAPVQQTNIFAILGLVFALLGGWLGLVFSIIGLVKAKDYNNNGKGLAIAGLVISIIWIVIIIIIYAAAIAAAATVGVA